jgi:hypothetical protein
MTIYVGTGAPSPRREINKIFGGGGRVEVEGTHRGNFPTHSRWSQFQNLSERSRDLPQPGATHEVFDELRV